MIQIKTFGYKSGDRPAPKGLSFDVRCLKNPHHIPDLRPLDGRNAKVQEFVGRDPIFKRILQASIDAAKADPNAEIVFGCFGGRHRSVACAELLGAYLKDKGVPFEIAHRELAA